MIVPRLVLTGGTGAPVLLIHGFASDRLSWLANQHELAKVATVYTLDLPGHGDTPDGGIADLGGFADGIVAALASLDAGPVALVGHSLGGAIAVATAARAPQLVRRLALIAPAGLAQKIDRGFVEDFPRAEGAEAIRELMLRLVSRPRLISPQMVAYVEKQLARPGARAALARIGPIIDRMTDRVPELLATLDPQTIPRLLIWGEADRIAVPDVDKLANFGGGTLVVAGAGHLPHVEEPRQVNQALAAFLTAAP